MGAIIFGLGNPGDYYANTRHNFGFAVLGELANRWKIRFKPGRGDFMIAKSNKAILVKPITFMNRSGEAVLQFRNKHGQTQDQTLVVYDDLDLPLGSLRFRARGSSAGHRGVESISRALGDDRFHRLRLGIDGEFRHPITEKYVIERFRKEEEPLANKMIDLAADGIEIYLKSNIFSAMSQFNKLKYV